MKSRYKALITLAFVCSLCLAALSALHRPGGPGSLRQLQPGAGAGRGGAGHRPDRGQTGRPALRVHHRRHTDRRSGHPAPEDVCPGGRGDHLPAPRPGQSAGERALSPLACIWRRSPKTARKSPSPCTTSGRPGWILPAGSPSRAARRQGIPSPLRRRTGSPPPPLPGCPRRSFPSDRQATVSPAFFPCQPQVDRMTAFLSCLKPLILLY